MGFWSTLGSVAGTAVGTAIGGPVGGKVGGKLGSMAGSVVEGSGDKGEDNQQNAQVASKTSSLDVTGLMNPSTVSPLAGSIQVAQGSNPYSLQKTAASWFNPPTERA
jgi:phage tail tape-measure protein